MAPNIAKKSSKRGSGSCLGSILWQNGTQDRQEVPKRRQDGQLGGKMGQDGD